jgi:hypothetical protein
MVPTHEDGTPESFTILGLGSLTQLGDGVVGWSQEAREIPNGPRAATEGELIGDQVVPPVVGYECDGARYKDDGHVWKLWNRVHGGDV